MDDFVSIFLYILFLLVIVLAGGLSKKKKKPFTGEGTGVQKKTGTSSAILEALLKGAGLPDILPEEEQEHPEETFFTGEPEGGDTAGKVTPRTAGSDGIADLLPGEEGEPVFKETAEIIVSDDESIDADLISTEIDGSQIQSNERPAGYLSKLVRDFDLRKAIIYTEIMNPKYF